LTAATVLFGFVRNMVMFHVLVKSAQALHNRMFNCILRTPVRFFDVNPIGKQKFNMTLAAVSCQSIARLKDYLQEHNFTKYKMGNYMKREVAMAQI